MHCLVYLSNSLVQHDQADLNYIALEASASNKTLGITGYLYASKDRFVQYLEGEKELLSVLFNKIEADKRHNVVHVTKADGILNRRFPAWSMKDLSSSSTPNILETILEEHMLLMMHFTDVESQADDKTIWDMIDELAKHSEALGEI